MQLLFLRCRKSSAEKLKEIARAKQMPLLFDDGIRRALTGATTLEEVFRVAFSA